MCVVGLFFLLAGGRRFIAELRMPNLPTRLADAAADSKQRSHDGNWKTVHHIHL